MASDQGDAQKQLGKRLAERMDLGWLASSAIQPGKKKEIEGVSATSLMDLQAQLYQAQEAVRLRKDGVLDVNEKSARKGGVDVLSLMSKKNHGVEERDRQDKLHIKSTSDRASECFAALERKAALYEKLSRGDMDDNDEKYEVDFLMKGGWLAENKAAQDPSILDDSYGGDRAGGRSRDRDRHARVGSRSRSRSRERSWGVGPTGRGNEPIDTMGLAVSGSGAMMTADMATERERRRWEQEEKARVQEEQVEEERKRQHKETIMELAQQTRDSRQRATEVKQRKEDQAKRKLDKLKEEFLKKQAKAILASKRSGVASKSSGGGEGGS